MTDSKNIQQIIDAVYAAYGREKRADYSFMESRRRNLIRHEFVCDMLARYFVKDDTDLNDHAALHLRVHDEDGILLGVCLSFVANFCMVFRFEPGTLLYSSVVDQSISSITNFEADVLALLAKHHFRIITRDEAITPIELNLFNSDKTETRIYHATIDDCGILPRVLQ